MTDTHNIHPPTLKMEELDHETKLNNAVAEANTMNIVNYAALARKHKCNSRTLSRRHQGLCVSRKDATSIYKKILTDAQEETLLQDMEKLSKLGLYITPRILQNTVEGIVERSITHDWAYEFHKRYPDRIKCLYLKGFDKERKIADNPGNIAQFYINVCLFY
jgi:hypothetical protein